MRLVRAGGVIHDGSSPTNVTAAALTNQRGQSSNTALIASVVIISMVVGALVGAAVLLARRSVQRRRLRAKRTKVVATATGAKGGVQEI